MDNKLTRTHTHTHIADLRTQIVAKQISVKVGLKDVGNTFYI